MFILRGIQAVHCPRCPSPQCITRPSERPGPNHFHCYQCGEFEEPLPARKAEDAEVLEDAKRNGYFEKLFIEVADDIYEQAERAKHEVKPPSRSEWHAKITPVS